MKKKKVQSSMKGFTLIELLVVIVVMGVIGSIMTTILVSSLRGTNKANSIANVKQSGNYAISQIEKHLRYAKSFDGVSIDDSAGSYVVDCPVSSSPAYHFIKVTGFDAIQTKFELSCASASSYRIASNSSELIDINAVSLKPGTCSFTCIKDSAQALPIIGIQFDLQQKTTSSFAENKTTIPFQTKVVFRNLLQ